MKNTINDFINAAEDFSQVWQIEKWQIRVSEYLSEAINQETAQKFNDLTTDDSIFDNFTINDNIFDDLSRQLGFLQALIGRIDSLNITKDTNSIVTTKGNHLSSKKIFVVHGHDNESKETISRFIENIGLEAIVLHEQPNQGLTIVEKFEQYADVAFAVVLLTPDDKGYSVNEPNAVQHRARQNVVLELGYFLGTLGRNRVCALHKGNVEIPSDYKGVLYIKIDKEGAWKNKLAQEFVRAQIDIKFSELL